MTEPMGLCGEQAGALGGSGSYLLWGILWLHLARLGEGPQQLLGPHICVQEWHRLAGRL